MTTSIIIVLCALYITALGLGLLAGVILGAWIMEGYFRAEHAELKKVADSSAEELQAIRRLVVSNHGTTISIGKCVYQQHEALGLLLKEREADAERNKGCLRNMN